MSDYYDGFSPGRFIKALPRLNGKMTDPLIGDLFTDGVDEVWKPMESLYPKDKPTPPLERRSAFVNQSGS